MLLSMLGVLQRTGVRVAAMPDYSHENGGDYLANTRSALKRVRSSEKRRIRNREVRSETRTYIKRARMQIESGQLDEAQESVAQAIRALDNAAQKGVIHKNNAARRKSRLMHQLNQAMQSVEA
jgi:small subunit ribosomal protein S20